MLPIFDTAEHLEFNATLPPHLKEYKSFKRDYLGAHAFLYAYKDNRATFNAYRREVERLLHWSWQKANMSIFKLRRVEIESYIKFCQKPPKRWIGLSKPARFINEEGQRLPNPNWRPFVATVSKTAARSGEEPNKDNYALSEKAIKEILAVLSTFYQFLIQDEYTEVNPITQIRQKSKFIRKQQSPKRIRRLSDLQWSFVIETAELLAQENSQAQSTSSGISLSLSISLSLIIPL